MASKGAKGVEVTSTALTKLAGHVESVKAYRDDPVGFAQNVLDVDPHPGQRKWLIRTNFGQEPENALVGGNRFGKSTSAAIRLIHRATYQKGWDKNVGAMMARKNEPYHSMNISITADQAAIVFNKMMGMLGGPKAAWLVKEEYSSPFPAVRLINGALIEARSTTRDGTHLLGHSLDHVNFDEAAQHIRFRRLLDNVLRARMVDRAGVIDYTTTGNGRNEFGRYFLEGLEGKNPDLYTQVGSSFDNPFTNLRRFAQVAEHMSDRMKRQNIDGAIIDAGDGYFDANDLDAAHNEALDEIAYTRVDKDDEVCYMELRPLTDGKPIPWIERYPGHKYITGWDIADKKDYNVGYTFDISSVPAVLVEFQRFHKLGWEHNFAMMRRTNAKYGAQSTKFDSTGIGDVATDMLADIKAEGINFAGTRKDMMLTNIQVILSERGVQWPWIQVMQNELRFYERDDTKLMTDCVMGLAVAGWWVKRAKRFVFAGHV